MARAIAVADLAIVLRALVGVLDHQRDRRAGRHRAAGAIVLEHAGQDLHLVLFLALRDEARGAGFPLVEELLDELRRQRQPRRAAIDHAADGRPMAFAPGRHAEEVAKGVVRHAPALKRNSGRLNSLCRRARANVTGGFSDTEARLRSSRAGIGMTDGMTGTAAAPTQPKAKVIGFWQCWAFSVGTMIGTGIFMMPALLAPYGGLSFGGWLIAAGGSIAIALCARTAGVAHDAVGRHADLRAGCLRQGCRASWSGWSNWVACVDFHRRPGRRLCRLSQCDRAGTRPASRAIRPLVALAVIWTVTLVLVRGVKEAGFVQLRADHPEA